MTKLSQHGAVQHVSVVGIGNVLLGDDGFGPLVIEMFRCHYECGPNVEVMDLGTPGLDIAPYLYDRDLVILVDAVNSKAAPGALSLFRESDIATHRAQPHLTGHDPGIQESLAHLTLAGHAPRELIVLGAEPLSCEFGEGISDSVLTAAIAALAEISDLLNDRGIRCAHKASTERPNIWWLPQGAPTSDLL